MVYTSLREYWADRKVHYPVVSAYCNDIDYKGRFFNDLDALADQVALQIDLIDLLGGDEDDRASGMGPAIVPQPPKVASTDRSPQTPSPAWRTYIDRDEIDMDDYVDALDGNKIRVGFDLYKEFDNESSFYGSSILDRGCKAGYVPIQLNGSKSDCLSQTHYNASDHSTSRQEEEVKGEREEEGQLGAPLVFSQCVRLPGDSFRVPSIKFDGAYSTCEKERQSILTISDSILPTLSYTSEIVRAISDKLHTDEWLLDSGASSLYTPYKKDFVQYEEFDVPYVANTTDKSTNLWVPGWGTVILETLVKRVKGEFFKIRIELSPVLYLEGGLHHLISPTKLCQHDGIRAINDGWRMTIADKGTIILNARPHPNSYNKTLHWVNTSIVRTIGTAAFLSECKPASYYLLHQRMGHPSDRAMRHLWDNVTGLNAKNKLASMPLYCKGCIKGKTVQAHHPDDPT
jgi:hypothetical protein